MNRYFGTHTLEGEWHSLLPRYLLLGERIAGSRVLDVGCGTGIGSSLLLELGAESVDGIDHRPEVLELARMKHDKQGLDFHVMFWEELDFPDDSFDVVVCLDPASPTTDPNLLTEVRRVLSEGGEYICALERTTVAGLESLLPRYGYTSSADEVSIAQDSERVPQIGELATYFDTLISLVQRPHVSYVFEPEANPGEANDADEVRRVPDANGGLWAASDDLDTADQARSGKWIPVDRHLSSQDAETAAVEIFFCGDAHLPPPPLREIRLPYYHIVERLEQLINDLQMRQNIGGEPSSFEVVLDEPAGDVADEATGDSSEWDHTPTQVLNRSKPDSRTAHQPARIVELESQMTHLAELHQQVRRDFDNILRQTEAALGERDEYIDHLVQTVHEWESRFADEPIEDVSETAKTGVFEMPDAEDADDPEESLLDELAELDDDAGAADIEEQIASLEKERERIDQTLAAREARLEALEASSSNSDEDVPAQADGGAQMTDEGADADESEADAADANEPDESSEAEDVSETTGEAEDADDDEQSEETTK
ncbi:MAG: methyltransferase domain-containing protein [Persicimonas sp.]